MASIYYPAGCGAVPAHVCNPCGPVELGRVRGCGWVHKSVEFTDASDLSEWQTHILAGLAFVVPETNGTFDGGKNNEAEGYGDVPTVFSNADFSVKFKDPLLALNYAFYESMKRSRDYRFFFRTETKLWLSDTPCVTLPMAPVAGELNSRVDWDVEVKWQSENAPEMVDIPATLFDCYAVAP